ncbi:bifunctional transcriptional activator/DNA repair enzyme AdaA, partial [Sedimenticola sp.]|uniref:bifunctional transcriptional activator/DNA repair enzyme AdaA n=1 Tax=Sedimenticola sp. TaxID=1940285 RepID=UPI003D0B0112
MNNQQDQYWQAVQERNPAFDDVFCYGVVTTGVYCRPSCNARTPLRKNVRFYQSRDAAEGDGLRPCKRCRPDAELDARANLMHAMSQYIEKHHQQRLTLEHLAEQAGMSASHFQRSFKQYLGVSPKKFQDNCRIKQFKSQLKSGSDITTALQNS